MHKTNEVNQLTHLFYISHEMKKNYTQYHDVVIIDSTFKTNRFNMVLVLIVGVNDD